MKPEIPRLLIRWALMTASLSALLFLAAGTTRLSSIRQYLAVFSFMLLVTMLSVNPQLAQERAHPGSAGIDDGLRFAAGLLFLVTMTVAALSTGRLPEAFNVPSPLRLAALAGFVIGGSLQTWAMIANPFFSPVVRLQSERGQYVVENGPYRYMRHPGYLAMLISITASALAIGSWLALFPAIAFAVVVARRLRLEDDFLNRNLPGYAEYANHVPGKLFPIKRPKKNFYVRHSA